MTRDEALRVLGLPEDATNEDIKTAYKEMAQILHPDKFGDNKKLADRATEQFKQVNAAREFLLTSKKGAASASRTGKKSAGGKKSRGGYNDRATELRARLAGIAAARTQLVAQLDHELDARRVGVVLFVAGALGAFLLKRIPLALAASTTALVWGIVQLFTTQRNVSILNKHIESLEKQRKLTEKELDTL